MRIKVIRKPYREFVTKTWMSVPRVGDFVDLSIEDGKPKIQGRVSQVVWTNGGATIVIKDS